MTATSAFANTFRRPTAATRNRHITTAIIMALYALLVLSAVWLTVVQPEPPRLSAQTPRSVTPHLGAAASMSITSAPSGPSREPASQREQPAWPDTPEFD
ncbi:hypothetical protein A5722_01325 [Mycobacterium vulneris]|uniref:Uncharacterized protein n=1 Tax=Mycolicibacterium septicum DSM 44393 TaxID=1341646 RepID=A0A7X6RZT7_9MYCO|nr:MULTISPECIES: hypothetical protein [Mycolicibacterium]MBX8687811.1 hypothetical protein [Mycobacterium sp. 20091114027_K0903767]MCP3811431.1 hypothetical protein [Mycobacteriaceae bacterium Msp059]OCB48634.1 hypothetical protein A5721_04590 [Mycolicibacterium vulneris]NKZ14976.1 hypothetical protein [Mycolicibacterium septicum DSM 44393]OBK04513.1 hypothetical protein A5637_11975 [Mycolicibacterium fortuitum]